MYFFKFKTRGNVIYEGLSSNTKDLEHLLRNKINLNGLEGRVEIFNGRKLVDEFDSSELTTERRLSDRY